MQVKLIDYDAAAAGKTTRRSAPSIPPTPDRSGKKSAREITTTNPRVHHRGLKTGHASPLEQIVFWFGTPSLALAFASVRASSVGISFEQQSQRYVKFKRDKPHSCCRIRGRARDSRIIPTCFRRRRAHAKALKAGFRPGIARFGCQRRAHDFSDGEFRRDAPHLRPAPVRARARESAEVAMMRAESSTSARIAASCNRMRREPMATATSRSTNTRSAR